ncbi:hypothetical protein [Sphingobium lignivorans]|uniref:N-acetyltransferase domain-containing protein n=1 Tax=Sphingobium lignivorans TaxID=2735886 RepID=A0ABR6NAU9_9SPHN|nr:hypothetical protein [Sphingobium lignivorans]MBB5984392.1 hypothetical protein [Sphingobium lignivorans]
MTDLMLSLAQTDTADDPLFERFLTGYEGAFTLPDEMEDREGFARCLALNHGPDHARLAARFGAFRELCVIASDRADGTMTGGANFIAMAPDAATPGAPVTANLNYLYVCPQARGRGALRAFMKALHGLIGGLFGERAGTDVAIFIEQNDPFRMTPQAYERDSAHSGMDQFDRLRIWARMGAKVVDFPYVQPPLSAGQAADDTLVYSVMGLPGATLAPAVLRRHLAAFFGISVLKGAPLDAVPAAMAQLDRLDGMAARGETIALLDPAPFLAGPGDPRALLGSTGRPQSLREAVVSSIQS